MKKRYPFKFLDAYNKGDTDIFFGREEEVEMLYKMTFQSDMLLVYGSSGTGKTSLINCGLAGRFQAHDWLALNIRYGNGLNQALQQKLQEVSGKTNTSDLDLSWLDEEEETEELSPLSQQLKNIYLQYFRPIYLIFDQFEELYILGSKDEQEQFIESVKEVQTVEQPVKMIFVIREEYLGYLFEFERSVPQLLKKKLRVEPMGQAKVGQVIRGAASLDRSNIRLQAGQEEEIVAEIFQKIKGDENKRTIQLPYLQVFLDKLYLQITNDEQRQEEAVFSVEALDKIGDIGDVLRNFLQEQSVKIQKSLEDQYADLPEDTVWQILSPLATLEGTKEPMLEETLIKRLAHLPASVVQKGLRALDKSRILRFDDNENRYEVAHDSLAKQIAERRSDEEIALLEIRRLITSQMALKVEARELFSEKQLNLIDPFVEKLGLEPEALHLIEESRKAITQQKEKERQQAEQERQRLLERQALLEKNQKSQQRFIRYMRIALVVMAGLVLWAWVSSKKAIQKEKEATEALAENVKQQAITKAQELKAFGDSYLDLNKREYACESYSTALSHLEGYEGEALFQQINDKRKEACTN